MNGPTDAAERHQRAANKRAVMLLAAIPVDMADSCILEAADALKARPDLYTGDLRYNVEKAMRFSKRAMAAATAAASGPEMKGGRLADILDNRADAVRHDLFILRLQLKQYMDTRRMTDTDLKSRVWLAVEAAQFCCIEHMKIAETAAESYGLKVRQDLIPMSMAGAEAAMEAACKIILEPEWRDDYDPAGEPVLIRAVHALHNRLFDADEALRIAELWLSLQT